MTARSGRLVEMVKAAEAIRLGSSKKKKKKRREIEKRKREDDVVVSVSKGKAEGTSDGDHGDEKKNIADDTANSVYLSLQALKEAKQSKNVAAGDAKGHQPTVKKNEMDDIFSRFKPKAKTEPAEKARELRQQGLSMLDNDDDDFSDSRGIKKQKRKTVDGYKVYNADELKLGATGGTKDCPFDCKCCF